MGEPNEGIKHALPRGLRAALDRRSRARKFLSGRGALMAFFAFLPTIGEAIAIVLGLMRSNVWLTGSAMLAGKTLRYIVVLATFRGALSLF